MGKRWSRKAFLAEDDTVIVAIDIDGTVAWALHKELLLKKNCRLTYNQAVLLDPLIREARPAILRIFASGHRIVFVTNRRESGRFGTTAWIKHYFPELGEPEILMKKDGDNRSLGTIKADHYRSLADQDPILVVCDNRDECLDAARNYGLPMKAPECWDKFYAGSAYVKEDEC